MLIDPAYAQTVPMNYLSPQNPMWILIIMVAIMYFLIWRPQQRKMRQHQDMVKALRRGDTVVTNGGLVAKVTKVVDDEQIELELGSVDTGKGEAKGVRVRQLRSMISEVRAKGEPAKEKGEAAKEESAS